MDTIAYWREMTYLFLGDKSGHNLYIAGLYMENESRRDKKNFLIFLEGQWN